MIISITRKLEFDAAHRVLGHGGKCRHLHGHRYVAEIQVASNKLNQLGMVADFSFIKELVGGWIDKNWDHNIILNSNDPLYRLRLSDSDRDEVFGGREPFLLFEKNPTVEVMAETLFEEVRILLPPGITLVGVRLYETPNCYADYLRST